MTEISGDQTSPGVTRPGLSVRLRIAATVAALVTLALAGAGLIVYVIELERIENSVQREVEQELGEFARLEQNGIDPRTGEAFDNVKSLLRTFLRRNVPDDDELLVAWVDGAPWRQFPEDDLTADPVFLSSVEPLVTSGGTTRIDTDKGEVRITSQPVSDGDTTGALLVVAYLDEDRAELEDTMRTYAIVAVLSSFIITWAAWWQAGRLLGPLRALRRTADEISATDLSRRVPETGNDDITALSRTVNGMLDRLEAAFVGQREFLDDAGHELRTPLTVLRGHLELLDAGSPADIAETKALLLDETDRMARLVGDLILLAKSGRPDFVRPAPVDLTELTVDVLAKARGLGDRAWALDGTASVTINVDAQRLTQALLQLCDNAVRHTAPGQVVAVGSSYDDDTALLWVRDSGRGVPPEDRERIFERFGRGTGGDSEGSRDEGFGLGLSIVRAIATAHGGTVHVQDAEPRGAWFIITLPLAGAPTPGAEEAEEWTRDDDHGDVEQTEELSAWQRS